MYWSKYFLNVNHDVPKDAVLRSHQIMQQSCMIKKEISGIYSWLPFGFAILQKVVCTIREVMNASGYLETLAPCIQSLSLWKQSGREGSYGKELLRIKDRHNQDLIFSPTCEELMTNLARVGINSYRCLPKVLYQIQWKFRDEIRPRSGLIRSREFLMKDAYSFDIDAESAYQTYLGMCKAYFKIYKKLGLNVIIAKADSGPIGGDSHEIHFLSSSGQDTVYYDKRLENAIANLNDESDCSELLKYYSSTSDVHEHGVDYSKLDLIKSNSFEVGHIFLFGNKYSKPFKASVEDSKGNLIPLYMGSHGIGISRLISILVEHNSDERGLKLPMHLSPFKVAIIPLNVENDKCTSLANQYYKQITDMGIDVLLDDSNFNAKIKLKNNDMIGIPLQIILGPKLLDSGKIEIKNRIKGSSDIIDISAAIPFIMNLLNTR